MHFWYLMSPLQDKESKETIESKILVTFLKVIYDPYLDLQNAQAINQLIIDTGRLINDIKRLELELDPDLQYETLEEQ